MNIIIRLIITAAVAFALTYFLKGVHFNDFYGAVVFAIVFGLLNTFIKPVLKILGLPLTIISLGLFSLVINAAIVLIADYFVAGMSVDGFWWALVFSLALSIITSLLSGIFTSEDK